MKEADGISFIIKKKNIYYVNRFSNLKRVLSKPDTRFIIRHNHKLRGEIINVGENSILDFQGGSLSGGSLLLNDNVIITGSPVFYYSCSSKGSDTEYTGFINQGGSCVFRSPIIIKDKSNILIENAQFIMKTERDSKKWHGAIICYGEKECKNIIITNCIFDGGRVAFYSNVNNSEINKCKFINIPFGAISIETAYDHSPWRHPKDIRISNNIIEQNFDAKGENGNVMWCSGVEGLTIKNNSFKILQGILLYCGDGNIVLKDVEVLNNNITLLTGYDGFLKNMAAISIMGKSYQYLSEKMPEQFVVVKDNFIITETVGNVNASDLDNVGISLLYASNTTILNNVINGFSLGIDACDHFRGNYYHVNRIKINNNRFIDIKKVGINVDCEPQVLEIVNNEFTSGTLQEKNGLTIKFITSSVSEKVVLKNNKIY